MDFVKSATRQTAKFYCPAEERNNIINHVNNKFHDVQVTASPHDDNIIIVNMTGSRIYDFQVREFLEICGAEIYEV